MKKSEWAEGVYEEFMESYDFARCQRPDGSIYGTGGTCRKGTPVGEKVEEKKEKVKGAQDYPKGGTGGGEVPGSPNIKVQRGTHSTRQRSSKRRPRG